jgi:predicted nucleic acid-binding protein
VTYLLDTNAISESRRPKRAHPKYKAWVDTVPADLCYVSAISILEIELGVLTLERRDKLQGAALRGWLERRVLPQFKDRILAVDVAVARRSARFHVPDRRPERDALIAATALIHNLIVVTRNISDFEPTGVTLLNPWA